MTFSRQPPTANRQPIVIGPVPPYRAGIAYCTMKLAEELNADVISFKRQFPRMFYPGSSDVDPTLPRYEKARFLLDVVNPLTWLRTALLLRRERPATVILVWWVWVWALPYLTLLLLLPRTTRVMPLHPLLLHVVLAGLRLADVGGVPGQHGGVVPLDASGMTGVGGWQLAVGSRETR